MTERNWIVDMGSFEVAARDMAEAVEKALAAIAAGECEIDQIFEVEDEADDDEME
jgi:hypothetical protein